MPTSDYGTQPPDYDFVAPKDTPDGKLENAVNEINVDERSAGGAGLEKYNRQAEALKRFEPTGDIFEDYLTYMAMVRNQTRESMNVDFIKSVDSDAGMALENQDEEAIYKILEDIMNGSSPGNATGWLGDLNQARENAVRKIIDAYQPGYRVEGNEYKKAA